MGIHGIYGEIGPGERIALSKLAIEKLEESDRPLRIAIDVSIWQFQTQAGHGGSNPALRTFYYRLLRLLSTPVQAIFVFDGPHKPPFKRNKRSSHSGASLTDTLTKQLLSLFGFPFTRAPGEAEAECAFLQREGIVDAVLSEDVDTLMFGCGRTLRNWSSEGSRGNKSPTHVSVYDAKATREGRSGLDREGMVLVALLSGGDYITEGIPGFGIKVACEAARAGYGKSLCQLSRADSAGLEAWKQNLNHELQTNESKFFRTRHKALKIPDNFPNKEVLGYYTHPVVSSSSKVQKLKSEIVWEGKVDVQGLRLFVADAFEWTQKTGARKFIRGLAPAMLVHKLLLHGNRPDSSCGDVILTAMDEIELVRAIHSKRNHFSTDGLPELRVIYHPLDIVGLDLDAEEDCSDDYGRDGLATVQDDYEIETYESDDVAPRSRSHSPTKRSSSVYDPTQPDKAWISETIAKIGIPLMVEDYEESFRDPIKFLKAKSAAKKAATKGGMPKGALDRFIKPLNAKNGKEEGGAFSKAPRKEISSTQLALPPVYLAPNLETLTSLQPASAVARDAVLATRSSSSRNNSLNTKSTAKTKTRSQANPAQKRAPNINPWTSSRPISSTHTGPLVTKHFNQQTPSSPVSLKQANYEIDSSSATLRALPKPALKSQLCSRKHVRSPTPPYQKSDSELDLAPAGTLSRKAKSNANLPSTPSKLINGSNGPSKKRVSPAISERTGSVSRSKDSPFNLDPKAKKLDSVGMSPAASSSPPLPGVSELFSIRGMDQITVEREVIDISSSPTFLKPGPDSSKTSISNTDVGSSSKSNPQPLKSKKYISLRESLPGAWKEIDEKDFGRAAVRDRAWRQSQVEILDLSGDT